MDPSTEWVRHLCPLCWTQPELGGSQSGRVLSTDCKILWLCSASVFLFLGFYASMECSGIMLWSSVCLTRDGRHILMLSMLCMEVSRKLNMHWILYQLTLTRKWTKGERQKDWARKWRTWKRSFWQFFRTTFSKEWTKQVRSCSEKMWTYLLPWIFLSLWKRIFSKFETNLVTMNWRPGVGVQIQIIAMGRKGNESEVYVLLNMMD